MNVLFADTKAFGVSGSNMVGILCLNDFVIRASGAKILHARSEGEMVRT